MVKSSNEDKRYDYIVVGAGAYEDYAEAGEFIDTVPISESDRRKIAYDNAKALHML